jgi:2-hydroxycyclohexanecarboxyl-CoA dehydrogenase
MKQIEAAAMKGLQDKVCLVTGGAGAIGRAICHRLAEERAMVCVLDCDGARTAETVEWLRAKGSRVSSVECDIAEIEAVRRAVVEAEKLGPIDVLVNCAGWDKLVRFVDSHAGLWDRLIGINLRGPIALHHAVLPSMIARRAGRIINIASDAGRVGSSGEAVYSACKGGIIAFTKSIAREVAAQGITVNAVCPGPTDTPILRSFLDEGEWGKKTFDALTRAIPMRRLGEPDDICGMVAFLASDEARFVTGQVISVSGGLTMNG